MAQTRLGYFNMGDAEHIADPWAAERDRAQQVELERQRVQELVAQNQRQSSIQRQQLQMQQEQMLRQFGLDQRKAGLEERRFGQSSQKLQGDLRFQDAQIQNEKGRGVREDKRMQLEERLANLDSTLKNAGLTLKERQIKLAEEQSLWEQGFKGKEFDREGRWRKTDKAHQSERELLADTRANEEARRLGKYRQSTLENQGKGLEIQADSKEEQRRQAAHNRIMQLKGEARLKAQQKENARRVQWEEGQTVANRKLREERLAEDKNARISIARKEAAAEANKEFNRLLDQAGGVDEPPTEEVLAGWKQQVEAIRVTDFDKAEMLENQLREHLRLQALRHYAQSPYAERVGKPGDKARELGMGSRGIGSFIGDFFGVPVDSVINTQLSDLAEGAAAERGWKQFGGSGKLEEAPMRSTPQRDRIAELEREVARLRGGK